MSASLLPGVRMVRSAWRSPALRAALVLGLSGGAFAVANLMLARVLPKEEYGRFSLVLAIITLGILTGPLGAQIIVNRHQMDPGPRLFGRTLLTSALVGLGLAVGAGVLYPISFSLLLLTALATIAGASKLVTVGHYQSRQRYGLSLLLSECTNLSVLIAAVATEIWRPETALVPAAVYTVSLAAFTCFGWWKVFQDRPHLHYPDPPFPWGEAFSVVGVVGASMLLGAIERLVIPRALSLQDLATYSVLATLAGSPFQMLNQGVGFALLPSLRAARDAIERRRVLRQETLVVLGACVLSTAAVWWLAPVVLRLFLKGRYELPAALILAAIAVGTLKPLGSLAVATVNAVGSSRSLAGLGAIAWAAAALGLVGAWLGVHWGGLVGLVYGAGVGWLFRATASSWLAARSLQAPAANRADSALGNRLAEE
ncbi:MAG TPA: oligosaccharide flippase family protein [Gemmatimonadales bacterium]|nr:oligosaccharide flippase family protein [Gemmatimonadales bacterium]